MHNIHNHSSKKSILLLIVQYSSSPNQGLKLIEIAPGLDLHKDILNQMAFKPIIADHLKLIDTSIYKENGENLNNQFIKYESEAKGGILMNFDWIKNAQTSMMTSLPLLITQNKHLGHTNNSMHALIIWHII